MCTSKYSICIFETWVFKWVGSAWSSLVLLSIISVLRIVYCVSWCVGPLPNEADSRHNSQQSSPPTKENIWYVEGGLVTLTATPKWFHRRFKQIFAQNCFWEERSAITINFVPHTGRLFARYNYPLGLVFQKYCKLYAWHSYLSKRSKTINGQVPPDLGDAQKNITYLIGGPS